MVVWQGRTGDRPPMPIVVLQLSSKLGYYIDVTVCPGFVLRCYASVVIPLKPLLGRACSVGA